jgi:DNA-binding transcriptional ArsR family regulator
MGNQRFSIISSKAVRDERVTNSMLRTLAGLGLYSDQNGWCWPSLKKLSQDIGKSPQAISRDIHALKDLEYIKIYRRGDRKRGNLSNKYQVVFDYPYYHGDNSLSTSEVDRLSTSEVELTPHVNAPIKNKGGGRPKKSAPRDDRLDHPAIKSYRSNARLTAPIIWRDDIINTVGERDAEWSQLVKEWVGRGWNPRNILGMLDAFKKDHGKTKEERAPQNIQLPSGEVVEAQL